MPLGQVASIRRSSRASEISSEDGLLRVFVQSNVRGRDLGGFVKDIQQRIAEAIELPAGVTLKWSGQYESQLSAQRTLINAYLAEGNRSEAMRQYVLYRDVLRRDLGLTPTDELERLVRSVP